MAKALRTWSLRRSLSRLRSEIPEIEHVEIHHSPLACSVRGLDPPAQLLIEAVDLLIAFSIGQLDKVAFIVIITVDDIP